MSSFVLTSSSGQSVPFVNGQILSSRREPVIKPVIPQYNVAWGPSSRGSKDTVSFSSINKKDRWNVEIKTDFNSIINQALTSKGSQKQFFRDLADNFVKTDTNGDGKLSGEELFARANRNGNYTLDNADFSQFTKSYKNPLPLDGGLGCIYRAGSAAW